MAGSGKLTNSAKNFYLKLSADVIRKAETSGIAKKCLYQVSHAGMWCGTQPEWELEVCQVFAHLQSIVSRNADYLNRTLVACSLELGVAVTEIEEE